GLASLDRASLEADLAEKQAALDQAEFTLERALKRRGRLRPGEGPAVPPGPKLSDTPRRRSGRA
ncbi:MAG TPA: hypothetical protein VE575_03200, partial [Acidimicrobiales bacterium]|nr:hypothetical protein [Acidimicrobiales bacterium]